jgi:asparagine N-glycosylation enzyme membrane subunit Stt3
MNELDGVEPTPERSPARSGPPSPDVAARPRSLAFLVATAGVLLLAAAVRLVRWREAYWGPELIPLDGDAVFHFHRTFYAARHLSLPAVEPFLDWPKGAAVPFAPGYDVLGAAVVWLFGGPDAPLARAAVAAMPVALSVLLVGLAMSLASAAAPRDARRPAALAAGVFAALIPQQVANGRFGLTDHHVVEGVLVVLLGLWAVRAVEDRGVRRGVAIAALTAGGILFFPGTPLYLAIAVVPVALATLFSRGREALPGWPAVGLVAGAALGALVLAPSIAAHGRTFSFNYPSYLQPLLAGILGVGLAAAALAARAGSPPRRVAVIAGLVLLVAAGLVLLPGVARQLREGVVGYLLGGDPWLARNDECQPVWSITMGWVRSGTIWGLPGLALPLLAVLGLALVWRERRGAVAALSFVALAMAGLTALENRFGRPAGPVLAASGGVALAALAGRLLRGRKLAPLLAPAVAAAAMLADPRTWNAFRPELRTSLRDALIGASFDLSVKPRAEAAPGVLVPWDMANEVLLLAERPVVADGFGTWPDPEAFEEVLRAYALPEADLVAWMDRRRLGYVIVGQTAFVWRGIGPGAEDPVNQRLDVAYRRAVPFGQAVQGGSGDPENGLPHLTHFLPRFASIQVAFARKSPPPWPALWTFERVPGARVLGQAPPGARVVLEEDLVERGRRHLWRAWADADASGRYVMTVPLPTGYGTQTLGTAPLARIRAGAGTYRTLQIPESAVRSGASVAVEPLGG